MPPGFPSPLYRMRRLWADSQGMSADISAALFGRMLLTALACYAAGRLGMMLPGARELTGVASSPMWVAGGVALTALVHGGRQLAPAVWLGLFAAFLTNREGLASYAAALFLSVSAAAGCVVAALPLRRLGFHTTLDRRRDLLRLAGAGAVGMAVPATAAALVNLLAQWWPQIEPIGLTARTSWLPIHAAWGLGGSTWLHAWIGSVLGVLIVGVPLFSLQRLWVPYTLRGWHWLPAILLAFATVVSACIAFITVPSQAPITPWLFLPHVLLCWLAARSGVSVASAATLAVTAIAAWATASGEGPFLQAPGMQHVALLWGYASSLAAITLLVSALVGELAVNYERWQLALDGSNIGVCDWEPDTGRTAYSRRWLTMLGYTQHEFGTGVRAWLDRVHDEDAPRVRDAIARLLAPGTPSVKLEYRMRRADGTYMWVESRALVADHSPVGMPIRVVCALTDTTERRVANDRQRLAAGMFQHLHEGLLLVDADHRVLDMNPAFTQITGYQREEMLGAVPALLRPRTRDIAAQEQQAQMWQALRDQGSWRGEVIDHRRNGELCALQLTVSAVPASEGQPPYHVLVISDITEARLQREQIERHSHTDELTLLPNRLRLGQLLEEAMASSRREGHMLTLCHLDLDHFKTLNDHHGHPAGDRLLVEVAGRLRLALRGGDAVARLGGDEFVLLLRTASMQESQFALQRLMESIRQPFNLASAPAPLRLTASVGATVYPLDDADAGTLMRHADNAMYDAKQAGRNGFLFFDTERNRQTQEQLERMGRVQEALDRDEFRLYYQPKVDMHRGKAYGMEALLRWEHPELGLLAPASFLPAIEHTEMSELVGDWVMATGIAQLARWLGQGLDLSVSVNVSARHLQDPRFAQRLAELLAPHPPALAQRLELEVLETAALADVEFTSAVMEQCRALGVRFALDDFGTGYSNLSYLKRLPVDVLKIDRSFVHSMLDDMQDMAIVEGVMSLSRSFGCKVVAEGVESIAQARSLVGMGCRYAQGAGIALPMPADRVHDWVRSYRGAPFEGILTGAESESLF